MKGEQILPEILALVVGGIVFVTCILTKKSGEYTFVATALVSIVGYVFGSAIKNMLDSKQ